MNDGLQAFDILILLALAVFFISRLRNVLGKQIDDEGPQNPNHKRDGEKPVRPRDRVVQLRDANGNVMGAAAGLAAAVRPAEDVDAPILDSIEDADVVSGLKDIKSTEPEFSVGEFLEGAKMAFDMILDAFSKGDKPLLKSLLNKEIYDEFVEAIDARKQSDTVEENTLVSIQSADIVRAALNGRKAEITVSFVSEQVSVERDGEGNIVAGDPSETTLVNDEWTFSRDLRSTNPNWMLIGT